MAFTYSDDLADALSRVRSAVGDVVTPGLLPDATYTALITSHGEAGAVGMAAQTLAVRFAQKPTDVTLPNGLRVAWQKRIDQWNLIATGRAGGSGAGFAVAPGRDDGYTQAADEYTAGDDDE